MQNIYV